MDQHRDPAGHAPRPRPVGPSLTVGLGVVVLLVLGVVALVLAWSHAAGTALVPFQVPAVLAALVGLGLIGTGLAALDIDGLRRQEAGEAEALGAAIEDVRRWVEPGRPVRID